jgi:hypothetical protein
MPMESQATIILQRLESLEKKTDALDVKIDRIQNDVAQTKIDMAETKGRLSHVPTTVALFGFGITICAFAIGLAGALVSFVRFVLPLK